MPHPAAVGTHPPSSPTSTSSASSTSSRSSRRAGANTSGRQRHPGAHRDTNPNKNQPQINTTKNNIICGQQQSSQSKTQSSTVSQRQQGKQSAPTLPPSTERPGPEGEADEEEPSEIDSFLLDDNEIESEEENLTRTSNSSPIPNIEQLSIDREYLVQDNNEDEEDSDDLDIDLQGVNSIASSTSHRRFLLTENLLSSAENIPTEEFRVAGDGREPEDQQPPVAHLCSNPSSVGINSASEPSKISVASTREKISKGVKTTLIGSVSSEITTRSKIGSKVVGINNSLSTTSSSLPTDIHPVDPETQARLEALLEAAGIGKLTGETKQLTDPEVLKRLTSSVSCALDEAAAALTRMRTDPPGDGRSLVEACNEGDISKVRKLLDEGRVSVHDTTEEGESLLSLACSAGYFELAQVLLAMRANVEDRGMKGDCTPLMEAASAGHTEIVKLLLSHNAEVNAQSSSGNTPLMYACAGGHEDVVQMLLEAHANVEDHNENGHTPLMEAASAGHVGVAKILLKNGAGINTHSNEFKESALTLACYKGHLEMVRFLLDAGADQEHKTDEMHTALMEASMDGHVEVARLLLDSGAQVNMPADSFESPLTLAACGGHVELAMLLLERGANIEEVNDEGYTPLMEASREGHEEMVALLLSQGADINAQTEETQETALTLACCGGFLEVADFLIKAGANIELGASTPLMESAQEGHIELTKYLLQNGADVNAQSGTGDTALTYACENGHTDVSDLLLKYNAVLEHESEGGRTPLMKAARAGHLCTVQFLISKGADVNRTTTNNDHTPLSLACAGGHISIVELLLQHGADPYHKLKDNSTMLIEAAKGGHTNVVSILIDYPNSLVMTNDAAMSAAAYNDPINGPPHASIGTIHPAHQGNPQYVNAAAIHAGQVSISGQMAPDQMAIAMQQEHHSAQVVGGVQVATAHLQQTAKSINIVPTGQLTNSPVVSGPAPPPPPPPPSNQQNKSVLRKSQRSSANAVGAGNQQVNSQHSGTKESSGNKDSLNKLTGKGNTSSLASSAARSILSSAAAGMAGGGISSTAGPNIGIDASGFDYIEGSGFVMEGLEDKGLDAKSYIQSVLRRHEGGATREEQIIQKEQILAELQRVEKELKEKGPAATASNVTSIGPALGGSNIAQQYNSTGHKGGSSGGNTSISLNIPAATEILQNMANLTLQDQHHRGSDHHPCSSTVTSSTQTVQVTNQNCSPTLHSGISSSNLNVGQEQGLGTSGPLNAVGNNGKRSSNTNANLANLLPIERPKVKASRKIPGKESLSPSSKDNILTTSSANTSPGCLAGTTAGPTQQQHTGQTISATTSIVGSLNSTQEGPQHHQAKKSDSQLQAARHQHSQQLAQLQQLQQLNQQLQEQVLYQRQQKQQNQATLAALQQNAIANQQQLAALQQNVAQLQQLEQHILQQQQATSHTGNDTISGPLPSSGPLSSSSSTNISSGANSTQVTSNLSSINPPSNSSSAANQQHQQLQGKIQQIVQQKQQLQAQIKQFQQQVEQQLAYTQNATPGTAMGQLAREGVSALGPNDTMSQTQSTATRTSNKRSKDNAAQPSSSSKETNTHQGSKQDLGTPARQSGNGKSNRNKNQGVGSNLQTSSGETQPASTVANAAYELVQASQALQAVQALQQQHLDTSSAASSNQSSTSPGNEEVEPLAQDPALLTSLDPAHLAAAVQNCPLPLDANCQAILNGYKEGMQAGQALATTLHAAVNSGSMQIQYPIQTTGGAQGGSSDYGVSSGQTCQIGTQPITGGSANQMTATSIGLDQLLLQGPQFPFGQASVDSNGQINFTSATDLATSSYIQGPEGTGHTVDTSALFLPAGAQLSVPTGEHGQLLLHQGGGQMISQHPHLQPELPSVVQCPGGTLECLDSSASTVPPLPSGGTPGKKTKHGGAACGKIKKLQQVAHPQDLQDALNKQEDHAGDLFSAAAAAAAAAAATAGIPVQASTMVGQNQPGVSPNTCSVSSTIEAQQYAQSYASAACGPDGIPLPGAPSSSMDGFDANNEAVAAAAAAAAAAVSVDLDSATESNHDTALTLACAGGHEDLVTLLLGRGSDIEHRDKKGFTPLILAATAGHEKVVEILLEHNADIEAQSERTKDTPLSLACSGGRYEVVEVLLKKHANKEHRNVSDYTPLSLAASGGYVNIIKLLLAHGAEINSRTGSKLGISPLMLAAMNGHTASVKLLLDMGSDINAQIETNRNTALTLACFQGRHEVVSLLLDRKANVEHRAKTGLTPLMEAASGGYVDVGRVLLDKNADVNAPPVPSSRDTALTIAADKGHYRFVELLLSRGAQVDVRNKKGNSSLWLAANGGHIDVVQLLYSAGADIDSQDNRKVSCLMAAFRKGHSKVVKWMVKHVAQYPSDQELTRYIATINDKDLLKKCNTCMDIIRVAKDRQAAEAAKNANSLLEELDREKNIEESKKAAAARKREKKKRKKMERKGGKDEDETKGAADDDDECDMDGKEDADAMTGTEDEKEKTPDIAAEVAIPLDQHSSKGSGKGMIGISSSNNEGDSGIDANSQGSSTSRDEKSEQHHNLQNSKDVLNKEALEQTTKKNKNKNKKGKTIKEGASSASKERERNEKNTGSSVSTSEHEPTPPPLANTSTSQQLKMTSNVSSNIISFNKNDISAKNFPQTSVGKPFHTVSSTNNITNQYGKSINSFQSSRNDQDNGSENKENKKHQDHSLDSNELEYNRNDTRVPQTPDQQLVISTFEPTSVQGGFIQTNSKKISRGRRNVANPGSTQLDSHETAYSRSGGSSVTKQLLNAPITLTGSNSPRKNGSARGGASLGPNSSNNRSISGVVEDAGWKEVVRKSRKVVVSANAISRVIGRGGNNINAIRELSGAHIEVEKQGKGGAVGSDRTILIKGSADSTRQASAWINSVIANPDKDLSEIIGKPYRQLQAQQQSGTPSFIPSMMQQTVIVTNSGAAGISSSIPSTSSFPSNKGIVVSAQQPNSFGQTPPNSTAVTGGFTNLMAKTNNSGGTVLSNKLTGSITTASLSTTSIISPPIVGNKTSNKDNLKESVKDKDKKLAKHNASIPAFTSSIVTPGKIGGLNPLDKMNKSSGNGSFAAVAGGVESGSISNTTGATPAFGMISSGGPHPGSLNNTQKSRAIGKTEAAPPGMVAVNYLDSRGTKINVSQYSANSVSQAGQYSITGHGTSLSRSPGIITTTSSSASQFNLSVESNNMQDHNMGQGQSCEKDHNYGQYGKTVSQKPHSGLSTSHVASGSGGSRSTQSQDNKDYSPFKTLGVVSWGAPNLSTMDNSKEDKLGTANWATHLPAIGGNPRGVSGVQSNLQPPPSIPLPPSASSGNNPNSSNHSELERNKNNNQDLASKAPGYRANVNASPSWGALSNSNGNKQGASGNLNATDVLIYQQQQERCNSAPGTPISPIVPSPIGPPTSSKSGTSSNVSPGSEADGTIHSYAARGNIGPIGPTSVYGGVRSITPDDMDYRRSGISTLDNKDGLIGSINSVPTISRQQTSSTSHTVSSLANKTSILDHTSDLSILSAAAQMAASGSGFNDFLSQQTQKGFGLPNQNFNEMININNGINNPLLSQTSGNTASRFIGPSAPPPPLPPSMSAGLYNSQHLGTKLNPNAPDFMRLPGTTGANDFVRAPGPSGNTASGLSRNVTSVASSIMPNKYGISNNQYGHQAPPASRMTFGQGNHSTTSVGNGAHQIPSNTVSSSNQLVSNLTSLSNFSNILNNQSINALLNQANLADLTAIGNGVSSFDAMSANLVGGKSIREINEMLSGGGNPNSDNASQPFSGNGSSLFMNNPLLHSQHGLNNSSAEEQPKSKAIGSERHRSTCPTSGIQSGLAIQQPSNQGVMPQNINKSMALNRLQGGGLRTQGQSNPWDGPGYYDGSGDPNTGRQNQSGQPVPQFPFPSSLQGHTIESLLKSSATLPGGVDNFGDHSSAGSGPGASSNFIPGLGNGNTGAPPSPMSGLVSPANVTPNKNDFVGGFGGPGGDTGMAYTGPQQAPIGSAGKNLTVGYSLDSLANRPNDPAVNSVRRNMNTMWGNTGAISTKKWGDEM